MKKKYEVDFQQLALNYRDGRKEKDFVKLYNALNGKIKGFMLSRLGNSGVIDEAMSYFYLSLYKYFDTWNPDKALFSTWVYTMAGNCCTYASKNATSYEGRYISPEEISAERNKGHSGMEDSLANLYDAVEGGADDEETANLPFIREMLCEALEEVYKGLDKREQEAYKVLIYRYSTHKEEDEDVQRCKAMNKGVLNCSISDTMDTIKRVITTNEKFKPVVEYMKSIGCDTSYEDNRILSLFDLI